MFAEGNNNDVVFADINLSEALIRGAPHNPGSGGWPTIRFFTKETGLEGGNYVKKTSNSVCDELGNDMNMIDYIEDYAKTVICSVGNVDNCSEKEQAFIEKMKSAGAEEQHTQKERLKSMTSTKDQKVDLHEWAIRRLRILKQLLASSIGDAGDEL